MDYGKILVKVIVLGDSNVGKSSFIKQYVLKNSNTQDTLSFESALFTKEISVDNRKLNIQIWDMAGSERYRKLSLELYRGASSCILLFDVTSPASFEKIKTWRDEFLIHANLRSPENFLFILVGNKSDMDSRKVTTRQAVEWCKMNNDIPYLETSATDNCNVEDVFLMIIKDVLEKVNAKQESDLGDFIVVEPPNRNAEVPKVKQCFCLA